MSFKTLLTGLILAVCPLLHAQEPVSRIAAIDSNSRITLAGSRDPRAALAVDQGELPASTPLTGMTMMFARSATQEAALQTLLAAQQNPASPLYHQWLTPAQFGAQFGMSSTDLATAGAWLNSQGFTVNGISQSHTWIRFSGSASQVETAFGTKLHNYLLHGETHFAPTGDITLPAALSGIVSSVNNLSSFRLKPDVRLRPAFTSAQSGSTFFTPKDIETAYNINASYAAGYTGAGQQIAIVGQSFVAPIDIANFQNALGITPKAPTTVLVPNSGTAAVSPGDESESDLDLEYSGAIAPGASLYFVYTGNTDGNGVFDALNYAIDNKIAPVISISYGICEPVAGPTLLASGNSMLAQAAAQGQSVIASSGDSGSGGCTQYLGAQGVTTAEAENPAVSWPASSQYVTALGGTEISSANDGSPTYWLPASAGADVVSSVIQYIPETAWNDGFDAATSTTPLELSATGGGASIVFPRPTWQTGVTGIPAGSYRLVPDVSLYASPDYPGYLYCSSDPTTDINGSCSTGFRDANDVSVTIAGGTSFAAPIFAGMVAIINQAKKSTGQGVLGPILYPLAANAATYLTSFNDITVGNNECPALSGICSSGTESSYTTNTGYDEVTGLGSVNFNNLLTAWPSVVSGTLTASTTTLTSASTTPVASTADTVTIAVAGITGLTLPTGTVSLTVDGAAITPSLTLSGGSATYTFSSATPGAHIIAAVYSGDASYAGSTGTLSLNVGGVAATGGSITLAATNITVNPGSSGNSTITVTPGGGYLGTVDFTVEASAALINSCYSVNPLTLLSSNAPATTQLTILTSASACGLASQRTGPASFHRFVIRNHALLTKPAAPAPRSPLGLPATELALAGLATAGLLGRRRLGMNRLASLLVLAGLGLALAGCSGSSGTAPAATTSGDAPAGTYTLTVVGTDSTTLSITATTTFQLVVN